MTSNINKYKMLLSPPLYSAEKFKNKVKVGEDEELYLSKKDKNNIYKWYKIKLKKNPEEYYKQFPDYENPINDPTFFIKNIKKLTHELDKIDIKFYFIKWKIYGDEPSEIEKFQEDNDLKYNYILYSERRLYWAMRDKKAKIHLIHSIPKNKWPLVNDILLKYFPNRTNGIVSDKECIEILFNKNKRLKKYTEKIKVSIDIFFTKKINEESTTIWTKISDIIDKMKYGIMSDYDPNISNGKTNANVLININKIDTIEDLIIKIKNNIQNIKNIEYEIYD
jgi:hypothetical protein